MPTSLAGVLSYGLAGDVDILLAALLALGAIVGAQIGTWLLDRLPIAAIRWSFIGFLAIVAVALFLTVPSRDSAFEPTLGPILGAVALGLVTGALSGLLGVGGGIVVVPMLILLFGVSDLVANVAQVHVSVGDKVEAGQELVLLESMKMEIPVVPEWEGTVTDVRVVPGDVVQEGDIMVVLE